MGTARPPEQLHRAIGPRALAFATVNVIVGSGIFVLPALVSAGLGAAAILAYLVCGALVLLIGLCFAELGSGTSESGGLYRYIEQAFGPFAGFLANILYCAGGCMVSDAAISNALADILAGFLPAMGQGPWRVLFMLGLFGALSWVNITSVRRGVRFVELATLGKLLPLIVLIIAATAFVEPSNLHGAVVPSTGSLGGASLLLFFAFLGFETALSNGGEMKDPRRTVPRGLLLGIGLVLALYIGIQIVAQGVLGAGLAANKTAPLGALAGAVFGPVGVAALVVVAAVSMTGAMGGNMLGAPRILYAGGRDGVLPGLLARVHPRFRTPHVAIVLYASLGCALAFTGEFRQLAIISSAAVLLIYLGVALATIKLRRRTAAVERGFRAPGGILVPVLAIAGIAWLLSNLERKEWLGVGTFLAVLGALYSLSLLAKRRKAARRNAALTVPAFSGPAAAETERQLP